MSKLDLQAPFRLDLRSLALCRIGLAATILVDLALRARYLVEHYTVAGAVPIGMLQGAGVQDPAEILPLGPWSLLSPHLWNDTAAYQMALFLIAAVAAFALLLGYRTRIATVLSWFLLVSLHSRNPLVLNGGDELLRALMFWAMFLPWGQRFSVLPREPGPVHAHSVATVAFVLQLAVLFVLAGARKTGLEWTSEGTALFFALSSENYQGPLAGLLLETLETDWLRLLTPAVRTVEVLCPILLLLPTRSLGPRLLGLGILAASLLGFMVGLRVGLFPWIALCGLTALVPWPKSRSTTNEEGTRTNIQQSGALRLGLALLIACTGAWNVAAATGTLQSLSPLARWPVLAVRLDQDWNMFTPAPPSQNSWLTAPGLLENGSRANILRPEAPQAFDRAPGNAQEFAYSRSRKLLLERVALGGYPSDGMARLLCRTWVQTATRSPILHYEFVLHQEQITAHGTTFPLPPRVVFKKDCRPQQ